MKILGFNYEYPPLGGGGGIVHSLIAEELARRHEVTVITSAYGDLPSTEIRNGVEIHRVPVLARSDAAVASLVSMLCYPPAAWHRAARLLRRQRFDVVNGHFAVPTGPGSLLAAKTARVPHVLSLHGGDIFDPSKRLSPHRVPGLRSVVTSMLRRSDAVVAQSTNTRDNAYRYYPYTGPIEIIPLGIRQPMYEPAPRSRLGLPSKGFVLVTIGRLIKRKSIDRLLTVLARPECRPVCLVVVGDGPQLHPLQSMARQLGIADRVQFAGQVTEQHKWQLLSAADVYVSTTMHEGFGLVYLEAMAAGKPVITYDHGGQTDFLIDGETGWLVSSGDADALAGAIAEAARNPEAVDRIGNANRQRAPQHRIERCAQQYEALFERVLGEDLPPERENATDGGHAQSSLRSALAKPQSPEITSSRAEQTVG